MAWNVFFISFKMSSNAYFRGPFSAVTPPRTPLGELTTLPQVPQSAEEGIPPPNSPHHRRLWRLNVGATTLWRLQHVGDMP